MRNTGQTRTAALGLLVLLSGMAGPFQTVCAACEPAPVTPMTGCHGVPAPAPHPACCDGSAVAPAPGSCGCFAAAAPIATADWTLLRLVPAVSAVPLVAAAEAAAPSVAPVRLPEEPPSSASASVGLYLLHAAFLI
jgi:hypothetical protein